MHSLYFASSCDIVVYSKKYIFGSGPHFWQSSWNTWNFRSDESSITSFVMLMSDFWTAPKNGLEPTLWLESWNIQLHSIGLWGKGRERTPGGINGQWPMMHSIIPIQWSLHKAPKRRGLESWVGEHLEVLGACLAQRAWKLCALSLCICSICQFLSCVLS